MALEGVYEVNGGLTAVGTPERATAAIVDGLELYARSESDWDLTLLVDVKEPKDCDPGRRLVLRRLASGAGVSIKGALTVEAYAPPRTTCSVDLELSSS